jgi:5-formyltetrahydrofolate cyclo-ligase
MTSIVLLSAIEIVRRVLSAPWFDEATTIGCYLSMPEGEVDTSVIASAVLKSGTQLPFRFCSRCSPSFLTGFALLLTSQNSQSGKNLFVPKVDSVLRGGMDLLKIHDDEDLRSLPSGVWGIKEPTFQYCDTPRMKGPYSTYPLFLHSSHELTR